MVDLVKPSQLPPATQAFSDSAMIIDDGGVVRRATATQVANAGVPVASEAEALAGANNSARMTPLRVRQVLDNTSGSAVARAQAWAESATNPDPTDPDSKSAKTWSEIAEAAALAANSAPASWSDFQAAPFIDLLDGAVVQFNGVQFIRDTAADIPGLAAGSGWVPFGDVTPQHFGAQGNGVDDDRAAFVAADAYGDKFIIADPPVAYKFSSPLALASHVQVAGVAKHSDLTDGGKLEWVGGFWPNIDNGQISRVPGRLFVGDYALDIVGNLGGSQGGFVPNGSDGASWAPRDSALFVAQDRGLMAITGMVSNAKQIDGSGWPSETIAVSGFGINSTENPGSVWALYGDIQHETSAGWSAGLEVAVKNKGSGNQSNTPYNRSNGAFGLWVMAGGDPAYGGEAQNPSNTAISIIKKGHTWNKGLVIGSDALTGNDGTAGSSGWANAIEMGRNQRISWYEPTNENIGFSLHSSVSSQAGAHYATAENNAFVFRRRSDNKAYGKIAATTATDVAYVSLEATGNDGVLRAEGSPANINIALVPKGTGRVKFGSHQATADVAITGYIEIFDASGTIRKLAVIA